MSSAAPAVADVADVVRDIGRDLRALASSETELVRQRMTTQLHGVVADAVGVTLGTLVLLIGLGFLCTAAVAALGLVISALWLRLVIMAGVYGLLGGLVAYRSSVQIRKRLGGLRG